MLSCVCCAMQQLSAPSAAGRNVNDCRCVQPFTFTAGRPVSERKARKADGGQAGGSFSGMGGPKPPPALSTSVLGMKKGGKVRVANLRAGMYPVVRELGSTTRCVAGTCSPVRKRGCVLALTAVPLRVQRSVIVPPEQGYGDKGIDEIPGGATIELQIEVLEL